MDSNSYEALVQRRRNNTLGWRGPLLMLFARSTFAVVAQGLVATVYLTRSSSNPWQDSQAWLPVYGTLIDVGCLSLLWLFTRQEGISLVDLIGFNRRTLFRDVLLGISLIPFSLVFILGGVYATGWLLYGTLTPPYLYGSLPLPAALYGVLIWPFIWGLSEQMTYNGYLVSRFQVLSRSTVVAVACVAFAWSFQHVVMPLTFDPKFMLFRLLSPIPFSIFSTLLYLRLRRLVPQAITHALLDGAGVVIGVLIPALRSLS